MAQMTFLVLLGAQISTIRPPTGNRRGPFPYLLLSARPLVVCAVLVVSAILAACGSGSPPRPPTVPVTIIDDTDGADFRTVLRVAPGGGAADLGQGGYLFLNQGWIEGISSGGPDLGDVDSVFWQVFSKLPEQVMVYPTEHTTIFSCTSPGAGFTAILDFPRRTRTRGGFTSTISSSASSPPVARALPAPPSTTPRQME